MADRIRMLVAALRYRPFTWRTVRLGLTLHPIRGAAGTDENGADDDDGGQGGDGENDDSGADNGAEEEAEEATDDDPDRIAAEDDWKTKSRKNERRAKRERELREAAEKRERELKQQHETKQEKAVREAREAAAKEARDEVETERRTERLEAATTRLATRGVQVGEGKKARTATFADPDDALLRVEKQLRSGDLAAADIYDEEGKVNTDALAEALAEIATAHPHLVANGSGGGPRPTGGSDAGKGEPTSDDLESMSVDDHAKRKHPVRN